MPHCNVIKFHFQLGTEEMADTVVNGRRGEISLLGHIVTQKNSDIFSQMLNLFYAFKFSNTD